MAGEDRRAVLAAVARLPHRMQEVLVLRFCLGLPDQEIAAALGISRGTASATASRGLRCGARSPVTVPRCTTAPSRRTALHLRTGRLTGINAPAFYGPFDIAW
jgi:DNA-binding NarL/FixJ family response regulator